jgi:two-component system, response regulator YesN
VKLLLVDDDRISIDILAEIIKPQLSLVNEIVCAYDGHEAYDVVISMRPSIVITDIKMPTVGGIELIKKIRQIENYNPAILIISSYSDFEYAREAMKLSVCDYIVKPIDQNEIIEKINACIKSNDDEDVHTNETIFEKVQTYVSTNLDEPLKLLDISKHFHYNAAYLGRLIKEKTGTNFNNYILKLRIIKAQSLLINTNLLIREISRQIGFKDPEHFTKKFKVITGMTPSEYREKKTK